MDPAEEREPRLIKRYANRKLYDTQESRYVTLQQIADFVRDGQEVRILDNRTKDDLTDVTLAQIIYEEQKAVDGPQKRSIRTLRTLIQRGERWFSALREGPVVGRFVRADEGEEEAPAEPPAPADEPEKPEKRSMVEQSQKAWDELQRMADDRIRGVVNRAVQGAQALQAEVTRLQARIEELEAKLRKKDKSDS
ncbi:MAG: polyhydroxyalkanoate synthesis regulator DNA-binding domain-containing protein [Myxococcota bacterium]